VAYNHENTSFANLHDGAGAGTHVALTTYEPSIGVTEANVSYSNPADGNYYSMIRVGIVWNTSDLIGAAISGVTLKIHDCYHYDGVGGDSAGDIVIVEFAPSNPGAVAAADYTTFSESTLGTLAAADQPSSYAARADVTLVLTGAEALINKVSGYTSLGFRYDCDRANSAPGFSSNGQQWRFNTRAAAELIVEYSLGGLFFCMG
jgi:hypothetical protein